jgi:hypothetical protein
MLAFALRLCGCSKMFWHAACRLISGHVGTLLLPGSCSGVSLQHHVHVQQCDDHVERAASPGLMACNQQVLLAFCSCCGVALRRRSLCTSSAKG